MAVGREKRRVKSDVEVNNDHFIAAFDLSADGAIAPSRHGFAAIWSLRIKWRHFAPLRLGENESSQSVSGSRKGAKTQRSQREDPCYGCT